MNPYAVKITFHFLADDAINPAWKEGLMKQLWGSGIKEIIFDTYPNADAKNEITIEMGLGCRSEYFKNKIENFFH